MIVLAACETQESAPRVSIDDDLLPYFERFESEGLARGREAPVTNLVSGRLTDLEDQNIAGRCEHYANSPNTILVDPQYWQTAGELEKEYLIFHELGHCYLQRSHLDERNADGSCTSIMQSGTGACRMNYNYRTREGYLDELFEK